ncbi:MAG TPA: SDR family NAD(P)-dependent oxidoreductase [candidate division Zixibacteria bacterium]|nr:SDR family NAD(P)-dependent oxidoreductase [candidate division Zixibacteria bacterium]
MSSISNNFIDEFGPWALVAGASEGIGAAFAREVAKKGLNVAIISRRKEVLEELAKEINEKYQVQTKVIEQDLTSPNLLDELTSKTKDLNLGLVIFNAALSLIGLFHNTSIEVHQRVIDLNCRAPMILSYHFGNKMKERGKGGIILMSSLAGLQGNPIHTHYSATRAYNINLAEGLWDELKNDGIKVMVVLAGPTKTPNYYKSDPKELASVKSMILEPQAVAKQALNAFRRIKKPYFIPGVKNRFTSFFLQHFMTRKARIKLMGSVARTMYGENKDHFTS